MASAFSEMHFTFHLRKTLRPIKHAQRHGTEASLVSLSYLVIYSLPLIPSASASLENRSTARFR